MKNAKDYVNILFSSNMFFLETILRRSHVLLSAEASTGKSRVESTQKKKVRKVLVHFSKYNINIYTEYAN